MKGSLQIQYTIATQLFFYKMWILLYSKSSSHYFSTYSPFSVRAGIFQWYSAGLRALWFWVRVPGGAGNFSLHHRVQTGYGDHRGWVVQRGPGALSLGVKRPGREADHSPQSSAEVKNAWSCISTTPVKYHNGNSLLVVAYQFYTSRTFLLVREWTDSTQFHFYGFKTMILFRVTSCE
jgi:hypothetical protein